MLFYILFKFSSLYFAASTTLIPKQWRRSASVLSDGAVSTSGLWRGALWDRCPLSDVTVVSWFGVIGVIILHAIIIVI